ncbi:hypothetical protein SI859A1_00547 [Aurantimonas manganoxydans SI85-9A1]|uniref:Uncharacterized protein n=1 Tax=Aurantimonas manganoxydans (strain ATCC BAA-1229 / DSM 21871 / SI85-9A1) TaxID=287752 RepID=Q1YKU5_AURMS|nr:hypothetical protein SI859A1_00547 [Aurantimonas manganoxydans SI85-9A1]
MQPHPALAVHRLEERPFATPAMSVPAVEAEAVDIDRVVERLERPEERDKTGGRRAHVAQRPPVADDGACPQEDVDLDPGHGPAVGTQPRFGLGRPVAGIGCRAFCIIERRFDEIVLARMDRQQDLAGLRHRRTCEKVRIVQPFPHLPAAIDQEEMRRATAIDPAEAEAIVDADDALAGVDRGGAVPLMRGVADKADAGLGHDRPDFPIAGDGAWQERCSARKVPTRMYGRHCRRGQIFLRVGAWKSGGLPAIQPRNRAMRGCCARESRPPSSGRAPHW